MDHSPRRASCVLLLAALAASLLSSCGQPTELTPTESASMDEQSTFRFPTGFDELSDSATPCQTDQVPSMAAELIYASAAPGGGVIMVFDTEIPLEDLEYAAVIRSGEDELDFSCERAPQSLTQLQCTGPAPGEGERTSLSVLVEAAPSDVFRLDDHAPVLHDAVQIPDSYSLEDLWNAYYTCLNDPQEAVCAIVEQFAFPYPEPGSSLFDSNTKPGPTLLWAADLITSDPYYRPLHPQSYFNVLEALAADVPPNCLFEIGPLANACAPRAFMPLVVPEFSAPADIMFTVEYVWNKFAGRYETLFVVGDYRASTGELFHEPLDPSNWAYADLDVWSDYWCCGWLSEEGMPECIEFMVESKVCYEERGWDLFPPPPEPDCATEAATALVNQCLAESDLAGTGLIPTIQVGDVESLADAIGYLYGLWPADYMVDHLLDMWLTQPEYYDDMYPCAPYETIACIADWVEYQQEYGAFSMAASVLPPECDPEIPDSLWCQGMDGGSPSSEAASDCADEIGWTQSIESDIDRAMLLHTIALGLPWVEDLNGFPACMRFYNMSAPGFIQQYAQPLHSAAACAAFNDSVGELMIEALFVMPMVASGGTGPSPTATEPGICVLTLPPDSSPCWVWNPEKCEWECHN